jgi:hypothetical protein
MEMQQQAATVARRAGAFSSNSNSAFLVSFSQQIAYYIFSGDIRWLALVCVLTYSCPCSYLADFAWSLEQRTSIPATAPAVEAVSQ